MYVRFKARLGVAFFSVAVLSFSGSASAALSCSAGSGNTVGTWTCNEVVLFGPAQTDLTNAVLTLDKWTSGAAAGFTESLLSASWSLQGAIHSAGTLTNQTAMFQSFSFTESESFSFAAGAGAPATFLPAPSVASATSTSLPFVLASGASVPLALDLAVGPVTATSNNVIGFTGPGTFQALVSTMTGFTLAGGGGNIGVSLATTGTPEVKLTYTFATVSAVPEPSGISLMGAGLGLIFFVVRRGARRDRGDRRN